MTKPAVPPRLAHNEKLARQWMGEHGVRAACPKVSEQVPTTVVNRHALFPSGYNPSLIQYQGRWLMTYRWHPDHTAKSSLAIAELDDKFNVLRNEQLHCTMSNVEDARCFTHHGLLWASYIESKWPEHLKCLVKYGHLNRSGVWRIEDPFHPEYGKNDGENTEKNWGFWEHKGKLYCLYQCWPEQIVLEVEGNRVAEEHKSPGARWRYGPIKSGLSPVQHGDHLLRFFHSRLDNEPRPYAWRYYFGASLMESEPPFRTVAVSKEPIARGSEDDDLNDSERSTCPHRKPNVIFPTGCVAQEKHWLVSVGINDCECAVLKLEQSAFGLA